MTFKRPGAFAFLLALLAFGLPAGAKALTLTQIETEIRRAVHDTGESGRQNYTDAMLLDLINEGQRQIVSETWCLEKSTTITVISGTSVYTLPSDFLAPIQVLYTNPAGTAVDLEAMTRNNVYESDPNWESASGTISGYWVKWNTTLSVSPQISLFDVPGATGTITVQYYNSATNLSSDSDVPLDGVLSLYVFHHGIIYYATARIKQIESKLDEASKYFDLFQNIIELMSDRLGRVSIKSNSLKIAVPEKK